MGDAFAPLDSYIYGLRNQEIPPDASHMARRCPVGFLAVWAFGTETRSSRRARDYVVRRHSGRPGGIPVPLDGRAVDPVGYRCRQDKAVIVRENPTCPRHR
ncbi:MAG: hypothetical protein ACR2RF_29540 [Geminicoccaceae bacterium]